MSDEEKTGPELVDEVAKINTLDVLLDRLPSATSDDDLREMIRIERENRALWITAQEKKKDKKAGVPTTEEIMDVTGEA